jgi:hypothetical protein
MSSFTASTVALGHYLDSIYDQNKKETELAYTLHVTAAKVLHDAQMRMRTAKRAIQSLNNELTKATAAAAVTKLVDRKRKAAEAAECGFNAVASMTRECYGTEDGRRVRSNPESPMYHAVSPVYSKKVGGCDDGKAQLPVNSGGDTPSFSPSDAQLFPYFAVLLPYFAGLLPYFAILLPYFAVLLPFFATRPRARKEQRAEVGHLNIVN